MLGTCKGRGEAVCHQAARISARSRAISNAKCCGREKCSKNFGPKFVLNRVQSHAPQHADARHRCWGPLRVVARLCVTKRHGFRRDLARFRTQTFAAATNFGPKSEIRSESIACNVTRRSMLTLGTDVGDLLLRVVARLRVTKRHGFRRDLARFRTQKFNVAAAKNFRKISVRNSF